MLHVAVSGAGGLVGSALVSRLTAGGHRVSRIVRGGPSVEDRIRWDPVSGELDTKGLEGVDALVHLAGENIASGRWNTRRKRRIWSSRVDGTRGIATALARMSDPPATLINASAIGYYGDRGDALLDESSPPGSGYLADLTRAWETAAEPAERAGLRVVRLRIGVVLSRRGGALPRMALPFHLGLGGRVGHGRQYVSWISLTDLAAVIEYALLQSGLRGAVNAVAPEPVTQAELARTLGRVLRRPSLLPFPGWAVSLLLGEMGRELLLSSTRILPRRLSDSGFDFSHRGIEEALRFELLGPSS